MEPRKQSTDSLLDMINARPKRGQSEIHTSPHKERCEKTSNACRNNIRLSPILTPNASPNSTRLYENENKPKLSPALRHRRIPTRNDSPTEEPTSPAFDDRINSTLLPSFGNSGRAGSPAFRDIFSPIPNLEKFNDITSKDCSITAIGSGTSIQNIPSYPKLGKTERRSSDIVFPTIKVDSYCEESSDFSSGRQMSNEKRTQSSSDFTSTFMTQDNASRERNKCLMVPATLVRTRSTDGRLMVGKKDTNSFPDYIAISKAWSKSEGNLFSGRTGAERLRNQLTTTSKSNEIKPDNSSFQFEEFIGGKAYAKLDPIKSGKSLINNRKTQVADQESVMFPSLNSATDLGGADKDFGNKSESESALSRSDRNRPTLSDSGNPDEVIFHNKSRSKSFSPRRTYQLCGDTTLSDCSNGSSLGEVSDGIDNVDFGEQLKSTNLSVSPRPRRKITPFLNNDKLDL